MARTREVTCLLIMVKWLVQVVTRKLNISLMHVLLNRGSKWPYEIKNCNISNLKTELLDCNKAGLRDINQIDGQGRFKIILTSLDFLDNLDPDSKKSKF